MTRNTQDQSINGHPIFAAMFDRLTKYAEENIFAEQRQYLTRDLHGVVLDLGVGTSAMFPYLKEATQQEPRLHIHGIEPDPYMRKRAEKMAEQIGLSINIRPARAESLPYEDEHFDIIIASAVFCTIADVEQAFDEVYRVLQPQGKFRFYEHVRSNGLTGRVQDVLTPVWKRTFAGCHLNRDTEKRLRESGLDIEELSTTDSFFPATPNIRGTAIRQ